MSLPSAKVGEKVTAGLIEETDTLATPPSGLPGDSSPHTYPLKTNDEPTNQRTNEDDQSPADASGRPHCLGSTRTKDSSDHVLAQQQLLTLKAI